MPHALEALGELLIVGNRDGAIHRRQTPRRALADLVERLAVVAARCRNRLEEGLDRGMLLDNVGKRRGGEIAAKSGTTADGCEDVVGAGGQAASVPSVAEFELERARFRDPYAVMGIGRLGVAQRRDLAV